MTVENLSVNATAAGEPVAETAEFALIFPVVAVVVYGGWLGAQIYMGELEL